MSAISGAAFFAADKYHHHIAANTWLGIEALRPSPGSIGLNHFSIDFSSEDEFNRLSERVSKYDVDVNALMPNSLFMHDGDWIRVRVQYNQ